MKFKKIIASVLVGLFITTGCDKGFEEINTNPNVPTRITPDLLLAGIIRNTLNNQVSEAWNIGNIVIQHTAKIQFVNEDRYLWNEQNGIWNTVYGNLRNLQAIIDFAERANPVQNNYLGVALILKSWMFSLVTDAYGDVPYSEAGKAKQGIYQPKYDTQEEIYEGILDDLKRANAILGTSAESISGDILYGGGAGAIIKWRKLANSLRLRYLLRISDRVDTKAEMQAIVNDPVTYPVFESNADNATLKYLETPPNQWPLFTTRVGSFDEFRLSKTLGDYLSSIQDPRLEVIARPTENSVAGGGPPVIAGIPNGLEDTQALSYNGGPQNVSRVGLTFACLTCNDNGPAPVPNAAHALLMTYAELQFILAEARERNMITIGNAETYYLNGIQANFDYYEEIVPAQYGIDLTIPPGYFTQAEVQYTGTLEEKLRKIGTQKWIALFFNGLEAWFDWRRTNIPVLIPAEDNLPVRFIYPTAEQSLNPANRDEAVSRQGPDDLNTRVWWDVD